LAWAPHVAALAPLPWAAVPVCPVETPADDGPPAVTDVAETPAEPPGAGTGPDAALAEPAVTTTAATPATTVNPSLDIIYLRFIG
jgi:hypothetical protein